jgi:hypothetical protein
MHTTKATATPQTTAAGPSKFTLGTLRHSYPECCAVKNRVIPKPAASPRNLDACRTPRFPEQHRPEHQGPKNRQLNPQSTGSTRQNPCVHFLAEGL